MTELPKSFEELGIEMPDLAAIPAEFRPRIEAEIKLMHLVKHLNGDWTPDFTNFSQRKWFPWHYFGASAGFACSVSGSSSSYAVPTVGSRLFFKSEELADFAGETYLALYEQFLLG